MYPIMGGQFYGSDLASTLEHLVQRMRQMEMQRRQDVEFETRASSGQAREELDDMLLAHGGIEQVPEGQKARFARRWGVRPEELAGGRVPRETRVFEREATERIADYRARADSWLRNRIGQIRGLARTANLSPAEVNTMIEEARNEADVGLRFLEGLEPYRGVRPSLEIGAARRSLRQIDIPQAPFTALTTPPPPPPPPAPTLPPSPAAMPGIGAGLGFGPRPPIGLSGAFTPPPVQAGTGEIDPETLRLVFDALLRRIPAPPPTRNPYAPRPQAPLFGR
jgi:hypothetical protein